MFDDDTMWTEIYSVNNFFMERVDAWRYVR